MENKQYTQKQKISNMLKWSLRKYWGVLLIYVLILLVTFPLLGEFFATQTDEYKSQDTILVILATTFYPFVVLMFSVVFSMILFSYMHNKRCVDLFGGFPLSKRELFFSRYLYVIVQVVVPQIIVGIMGIFMATDFETKIHITKIVLLLTLIVIANISFLAMITLMCGSNIDAIISYLAINCIYPICVLLFDMFPRNLLPGMDSSIIDSTSDVFFLLSPMLALFAVNVEKITFFVIWWILFVIVTFAVCFVMSKKRKAELAQNAVVFVAVTDFIKFFSGITVGLGAGWVFASTLQLGASIREQYLWFTIAAILGVVITMFILHLIYNRGFHNIKRTLITAVAGIVTIMIFTIIVATGAFGYDTYVPDENDVKEVAVNINNDTEFYVDGKNVNFIYIADKDIIKQVISAHKSAIDMAKTVKKSFYPFNYSEHITYARDKNQQEITIDDSYSTLRISYKLKNGKMVNRYYQIWKYDNKLAKKLENYKSNAEKLEMIPDNNIDFVGLSLKKDFSFEDEDADFTYYEKDEKKKAVGDVYILKKAIIKDYKEGNLNSTKNGQCTIVFSCSDKEANNIYLQFRITDKCKNTLEALENKNYTYLCVKEKIAQSVYNTDPVDKKSYRTIYFEMPKSWENNGNLYAIMYDEGSMEYMYSIGESTACEKISGNLWKYTLYFPKNADRSDKNGYNHIIFCQPTKNSVNITGAIKLPSLYDGKVLKLKEHTGNLYDTDINDAMYDYIWENK